MRTDPRILVASSKHLDLLTGLAAGFRDHLGGSTPSTADLATSIRSLIAGSDAEFLIAVAEDGAGAGFIQVRYRYSMWLSALEAHLEDLFVVPGYRRRRLGTRLADLQLVVMASSFHWMDRSVVLERLRSLLDHGGGIAITGYPSLWNAEGDWQAAVRSVIQRHVGAERRAGSGHFKEPRARHEAIVAQSAFRRQERVVFQVARTWTVEQILGHLFSTSFCSPHVLGERRTEFEQDLRGTLRGLRSDELFDESSELEVITAYK